MSGVPPPQCLMYHQASVFVDNSVHKFVANMQPSHTLHLILSLFKKTEIKSKRQNFWLASQAVELSLSHHHHRF